MKQDNQVTPSDQELHAYVDGALDAASRRAVEAHLASEPADAARIAAYREQKAQMHALYDAVLDEPLPERLRATPERARHRPYALVAAWFACGIALGWGLAQLPLMSHEGRRMSLPRQAAVAHAVYVPEVRHPVEVGSDQQAHLVAWLSKRIGTNLKVPVLTREGYELVGGRLLPGEAGAVAQFMYQDARGRRLTLYVSRKSAEERSSAFRYSREDTVSVFYWIDGSLGYALSGELPKPDLLEVATSVYKQLNP